MLPRSGRVDGGVDHGRAALASSEPKPMQSGSGPLGVGGGGPEGPGERGASGAQKGEGNENM